jgi:hypothetical protein
MYTESRNMESGHDQAALIAHLKDAKKLLPSCSFSMTSAREGDNQSATSSACFKWALVFSAGRGRGGSPAVLKTGRYLRYTSAA